MKRALDVVLAGTGLVMLSPVFALVALALKRQGGGSVLFRQERVGRNFRSFYILKFRTMVQGADRMGPGITPGGDPRVTRLGAFLRRSSLDELPQLWNALVGNMSLVGPRPPLPGEVELYEEHHYTRFDVKPGITGPWQVNGRNMITDFEEVIRLETDYIREWTIWKDLGLLLKTIPAVLYMRGAS